MASSQKTLKAEARKFLNLTEVKKLFPRSRPDFRKTLSKYQAKKIRGMIAEVKNALGSRADQIVKIGTGRKKFLSENGFPTFAAGVDLPGGAKVNADVRYINGEFLYTRGGELKARHKLYTEGDENDLIISAQKILKKKNGRKASVTAAGRVIGSTQANMTDDALIKEAAYIFNKYAEMNAKGETREIKQKDGTVHIVPAAHPSDWPMGILFEEVKPRAKNDTKKKTGKK